MNPADENGRPTETPHSPSETTHFVQVPRTFQAIKASDMPLALAWRLHTRQLFTDLFAQNYTVSDFILQNGRAFYQLNLLTE